MDIEIYYSPFFTGETYRRQDGKPRFEKVVGDAALLEFLELRLGLPGGDDNNAVERLLAYRDALEACKVEAFYEEAYKNDPLATAKEILRWRDLLVMEGFPKAGYEAPRLRKLAEVESRFSKPGTPERWKKVHESVKGAFPGVKFVVCHDLSLLPRLIRETLERLGVKEGHAIGGKPFDAAGKSISIRCFGTVAEAYQWAVDHHGDEVVICPDPFRLNAVLRNREKPLLAASAGGDSSVTQLFRLGLSLLERPLNVKNLLEYLRNDFSPIPPKMRNDLAWTLKTEGGRGEKWQNALDGCEDASKVETFLKALLEDDVVDKGGMVSKSVVSDWCRAVADGVVVYNENMAPYVAELKGLCDGMCRIMEREPSDKVSVDSVLKAVKTLYSSVPVRTEEAMAGSWEAVDSHRSLIDAPEKLWWLPCNGGLGTPYPYTFLLKEEMDELQVRPMTDHVRYDFSRMADVLGEAKEIVLFTCDFDGTDPLVEHPAVTICKQSAPKAEQDMRGVGKSGSPAGVFVRLGTIETGVDLYPKDIKLSATSTETLIGYPFDFVMAKELGFQDLSSLQLSEMTPTLGTVAHLVFQRMLEDDVEKSVDRMMEMLDDDFERRVDDAAKEKGEILLLPENRTLFANFKRTIRESIRVLLRILKEADLRPTISEDPLDVTLDGFADLTGSVDFHALTPDDKIVVIDFKYSKGKAYIEKLEEDKSIQLELYAEALYEKYGKKVVARAYYFFPINQLHTAEDQPWIFPDMEGVVHHKPNPQPVDLAVRIRNSKAFRQDQLSKGTLEMEEGASLEGIDYQKHVKSNDMIDLPADRKDKTRKAASPFADPTKYPILKNVIK